MIEERTPGRSHGRIRAGRCPTVGAPRWLFELSPARTRAEMHEAKIGRFKQPISTATLHH